MLKNYLPLSREIRTHWVYKDPDYFIIWCEMLFAARFSREPKTDIYQGVLYTINYGEFIFGRTGWAERLRVGEQKLRTMIKLLIKEKMIELVEQKGRKFTIYKVVNYEKYNHPPNQQEDVDTSDFEGDTNHQANQQPTDSQPSANQQPTTKEECSNNVKKDKEDIYGGRREVFDYYLSLKLIQHGKYTPAMDNAIKSAMKNNGYTIKDCKTLLDRHKQTVQATAGSEYAVKKRPLDVFFGQKVFGGKHLICAEYEDGGKYYADDDTPAQMPKPKFKVDSS